MHDPPDQGQPSAMIATYEDGGYVAVAWVLVDGTISVRLEQFDPETSRYFLRSEAYMSTYRRLRRFPRRRR